MTGRARDVVAALGLAAGSLLSVAVSAQEATDEPPDSLTATLLSQLTSIYADLAALIGDNPAEAVGWAQEDLENLGDWEYRIVTIDAEDDAAIEAELNALGNERWEVYWVDDSHDGARFFLKRSAPSYLSRVPVATMLRALGGEQ